MKFTNGTNLRKAFIAAVASASLGGCAVVTTQEGYGHYGAPPPQRTTVVVDPVVTAIGVAIIAGAISNDHDRYHRHTPPRTHYRPAPSYHNHYHHHRGYQHQHRHNHRHHP